MTGTENGGRGRLAVGTAFFVHAAIAGSFAGRVPAIKHALDLSDATLGLALFGAAFGTLAGGRLGGFLAARFGPRRVVRFGMPLFASLLVCAALAGSLVVLAGVLFVYGVVAAVVDVSMNAEGVVVERVYPPRVRAQRNVATSGLCSGLQ